MTIARLVLVALGFLLIASPAEATRSTHRQKPKIGRIRPSESRGPKQKPTMGRVRQSGSLQPNVVVRTRPRKGYGAL